MREIHGWAVDSPPQRTSKAENVTIWWRHHPLPTLLVVLGGFHPTINQWISSRKGQWCRALMFLAVSTMGVWIKSLVIGEMRRLYGKLIMFSWHPIALEALKHFIADQECEDIRFILSREFHGATRSQSNSSNSIGPILSYYSDLSSLKLQPLWCIYKIELAKLALISRRGKVITNSLKIGI